MFVVQNQYTLYCSRRKLTRNTSQCQSLPIPNRVWSKHPQNAQPDAPSRGFNQWLHIVHIPQWNISRTLLPRGAKHIPNPPRHFRAPIPHSG